MKPAARADARPSVWSASAWTPQRAMQVVFPNGNAWLVSPWPSAKPRIDALEKRQASRIVLGRKRLQVIRQTSYLHLDVRTPFGEDVGETAVEEALQAALGPHRESYALRGWHVLRVEETHVGSVHRLFVSFDDEAPRSIELADMALPLELGLYGLGTRLAQAWPQRPWQGVMAYAGRMYSVLGRGREGVHVRVWPIEGESSSASQMRQRLIDHARHIEGDMPDASQPLLRLLGPGLGADLETWAREMNAARSGSALDWMSLLPAELGSKRTDKASAPTLRPDLTPDQAAEAALALGLCEIVAQAETAVHNRLDESALRQLRGKRLQRVCALSAILSLLTLLICLGVAGWAYRQESQRKEAWVQRAAGHGEQVAQLNALRHRLAGLRDSLESLGGLAEEPYPVSYLLSRIGEASRVGGVQGLQLRQSEPGTYDLRLRAFTADWDQVEAFRSALATTGGAQSAEITEQRKESGQGKVFFDVSLRVKAP